MREAELTWGVALALAVAVVWIVALPAPACLAQPVAVAMAAAARSDAVPFPLDVTASGDVLSWLFTQLSRLTGAAAATSFAIIGASVYAALALFFVCRSLRLRAGPAFAASVLYGVSPYLLSQGVSHLPLAFYGVLPLAVRAALTLGRRSRIRWVSRRFGLLAALFVALGASSIEYAFFGAELFALALFVHLNRVRRLSTAAPRLVLVAMLAVTAVVVHWGNLTSTPSPGPEAFSLKPTSLFVAGDSHRLAFMRQRAQQARTQALVPEDTGSAYIGALPAAVALVLLLMFLLALQRRRFGPPVAAMAAVAFLLFMSSVGGVASWLRLFNVPLPVRPAHAAILIEAIVLLFGVWLAGARLRRLRPPVFVVLAALGLWEQVPVLGCQTTVSEHRAALNNDVAARGAILEIGDDLPELQAAYLASDALRFSPAGLPPASAVAWQRSLQTLTPEQLLEELRRTGFGAVYVVTKQPNAQRFVAALTAAGAHPADPGAPRGTLLTW